MSCHDLVRLAIKKGIHIYGIVSTDSPTQQTVKLKHASQNKRCFLIIAVYLQQIPHAEVQAIANVHKVSLMPLEKYEFPSLSLNYSALNTIG